MTNLTLAIDEDLLKQARMRALEQGTSVNALLMAYLEQYVGVRDRQVKALRELRAISERVEGRILKQARQGPSSPAGQGKTPTGRHE